jgi:hypothetical protein
VFASARSVNLGQYGTTGSACRVCLTSVRILAPRLALEVFKLLFCSNLNCDRRRRAFYFRRGEFFCA